MQPSLAAVQGLALDRIQWADPNVCVALPGIHLFRKNNKTNEQIKHLIKF